MQATRIHQVTTEAGKTFKITRVDDFGGPYFNVTSSSGGSWQFTGPGAELDAFDLVEWYEAGCPN